ncbi:MAG: uL22 family ribosomal protein [Patescibacteria group bacterium]|nr:uL22 family ribosomal protein [Patescibacteria group bacterium]
MEVQAYTKYLKISPRKLRLVAQAVKDLNLEMALEQLKAVSKSSARPILLTLNSAVSNAVKNHNLARESLKIKNIIIEEGARLKRMDKSHGARFNRGVKQKRMSHIKVILTDER